LAHRIPKLHINHSSLFWGERPRSRSYGRTAALRLIVQTLWWRWKMISFFFIFTSNGAPVEWNWQGKTEVLGEKHVPVPLCAPQIPHGLTRDRTRTSAVRGRRLTAWAMARSQLCSPPNIVFILHECYIMWPFSLRSFYLEIFNHSFVCICRSSVSKTCHIPQSFLWEVSPVTFHSRSSVSKTCHIPQSFLRK
jgi:hypothetical protein